MRRVLLIDDSPVFLKILERLLAPNYEVVGRAHNGQEGIELYLTLKPDFVLMDITMPNVSGKECLTRIREKDPMAKVLMVSGIADEATTEECLKLGAKGFVRKDSISVSAKTIPGPLKTAIEQLMTA